VVVHVVPGAEVVVVAAVARQLGLLVDDEMPDVEVLVGGEAVSAVEEKVGGVLRPGAPRIDEAGAGAQVGEPEALEGALLRGGVVPEEVLVRAGAAADTGGGLVEGLDDRAGGVVAVEAGQDPPRAERLIAVAAVAPPRRVGKKVSDEVRNPERSPLVSTSDNAPYAAFSGPKGPPLPVG